MKKGCLGYYIKEEIKSKDELRNRFIRIIRPDFRKNPDKTQFVYNPGGDKGDFLKKRLKN